MKIRRNRKANYSKEELEKAEILEAYTSRLLGEKISRKQRKLLANHRYEKELATLKQMIDFVHRDSVKFAESVIPSPAASQRIEANLMDLIRGKQPLIPEFLENPQPAYSPQQMGSDSELAQLEYDYGVAEMPMEEEIRNSCILRFKIVEGDEVDREYTVTIPKITLGSGKDAAIRLEGYGISQIHAQLYVQAPSEQSESNGEIYIMDMDSSSGTYVDGQRISGKTKLVIGSRIRLGDFLLLISDLSPCERAQADIQLTPPQFTVKLEELTDSDTGKKYAVILQEITIGRGENAQIRLLDSQRKLSRIHARLETRKEDVYIIDLNSKNGTYVDGKRITGSQKLSVGSTVKLGNTVIKILSIDS